MIVIGGKRIGFADSVSYLDDPRKVPRATDGSTHKPGHWVRAIVTHAVHGDVVKPPRKGLFASLQDLVYAKYQANTERAVSWHATLDTDRSLAWSADPARWMCWHASQVNPFTMGIELTETPQREFTTEQLDTYVKLMDVATLALGIQRQVFVDANGRPYRGMITRCLSEHGAGRSVIGVYGHRNVWKRTEAGKLVSYRGAGDPGDAPFDALIAAGYETFQVEENEDTRTWEGRQRDLNRAMKARWTARGSIDPEPEYLGLDGLPGARTRRALVDYGAKPYGMWIQRPSDRDWARELGL